MGNYIAIQFCMRSNCVISLTGILWEGIAVIEHHLHNIGRWWGGDSIRAPLDDVVGLHENSDTTDQL